MKATWLDHRYREDLGQTGSKALAEWLGEQMNVLLPDGADRHRVGTYVAAVNAGADIAVDFWRAALAEGVDLVNPRDFPWTLASGITAHAVCAANAQGPCLTLIGGAEAGISALFHGLADLESGVVDFALVAGIGPIHDVSESGMCCIVVAALTLPSQGGKAILRTTTLRGDIPPGADAAEPLIRVCRAVDRGDEIVVSTPYEDAFQLTHYPDSEMS
ncbi:MAG: hypothetical protein KDI63_01500 [Gammaproteobacteria bacterium]|nr:hypothetical protein [Gammaproteobacteria bacterium]